MEAGYCCSYSCFYKICEEFASGILTSRKVAIFLNRRYSRVPSNNALILTNGKVPISSLLFFTHINVYKYICQYNIDAG